MPKLIHRTYMYTLGYIPYYTFLSLLSQNQLFSSEMSSKKLRGFQSSLRPSTTCLNNQHFTHLGTPSTAENLLTFTSLLPIIVSHFTVYIRPRVASPTSTILPEPQAANTSSYPVSSNTIQICTGRNFADHHTIPLESDDSEHLKLFNCSA